MPTELEKARDAYREVRRQVEPHPVVEAQAAAAYIVRLESKVVELEAQIRNRGRRGNW